jgi:hypothetical protein
MKGTCFHSQCYINNQRIQRVVVFLQNSYLHPIRKRATSKIIPLVAGPSRVNEKYRSGIFQVAFVTSLKKRY